MRRPSRSPKFREKRSGFGHMDMLTERDYFPATTTEIEQPNAIWHKLARTHYLAQFNREWHAGKPADHKSEEESQPEVYEVEEGDVAMAEKVDPAETALGDGESSDSGITDNACDADAPIGPDCVAREARGFLLAG
eukprot:8598644-Pyramimonas_sp.AAC.1